MVRNTYDSQSYIHKNHRAQICNIAHRYIMSVYEKLLKRRPRGQGRNAPLSAINIYKLNTSPKN